MIESYKPVVLASATLLTICEDKRSVPDCPLKRQYALALLLVLLSLQARGQMAMPNHGTVPEKPGVVRTYYIAADEVDWDYTPRGRYLAGLPHGETSEDESAAGRGHRIYHKAIYREYTAADFKTLKKRAPEWEHLGILGPLIRAEVGDSIRVVFKNNTHLSVTMHPHGLDYKKDAEGALYEDGTTGIAKADDRVGPGATYTYIWTVPERSGPAAMDGSSVLWMYHSHFVRGVDDQFQAGGPIAPEDARSLRRGWLGIAQPGPSRNLVAPRLYQPEPQSRRREHRERDHHVPLALPGRQPAVGVEARQQVGRLFQIAAHRRGDLLGRLPGDRSLDQGLDDPPPLFRQLEHDFP